MSERDPAISDRNRLAGLFDETVDELHRYCLARCGSVVTAEDVVAQTFADAARTLAHRPGEVIDRAWLFVVAKRRLVDHWRSTGREARRVERLIASRSTEGPADAAPGETEIAARVLAALGTLPPRQRAALTLRYLDELSVAEVADELDVAYRATESLLARGRRSFSRAWKEQS